VTEQDHTPTEPIPVLRKTPELSVAVDGEPTPLVELQGGEPMEDEKTPLVQTVGSDNFNEDEVTGVVMLARIRLPRSGLEELDTAIADLEFALAHITEQERRLLAVLSASFISLFLPWFQLSTKGEALPPSPMSGVEIAGFSALTLLVSLGALLLASEATNRFLKGHRLLFQRLLLALLSLRFIFALVSDPMPGIYHRYSLWALVPALLSVTMVLAIFGALPAWPRQRPLPRA
jgi:hypothetical protein